MKSKTGVPRKLRWTKTRLNQLNRLRELMLAVGTMDNGSRFLAKAQKAIALANLLTHSFGNLGRARSFCSFLGDLCDHDRALHMPKSKRVKGKSTVGNVSP